MPLENLTDQSSRLFRKLKPLGIIKPILVSANHRGTAQKRRMFWQEVSIEIVPFEEVLKCRDPALHTGHVLDYSTPIDYLEFLPKVHDLRTFVNRAILKRLGYAGPMFDCKSQAAIEV
jgi:hypothetical protein